MQGLRERKKQRVRAGILEASERLLRERGFDATRVRDIIDRVEISEPTFFKYFGSKQAVVDELAMHWLRSSTAAWPRSVLDPKSTTEILEQLSVALGPLVRALEQDRDYVRLLLTHSSLWSPQGAARGQHAEAGHPLHEATMAGFRAMADFFVTLQNSGLVRRELDPLQLSEIWFGVFRTTLHLWATNYWQAEHDLSARLGAAFDLLLKGMVVEP